MKASAHNSVVKSFYGPPIALGIKSKLCKRGSYKQHEPHPSPFWPSSVLLTMVHLFPSLSDDPGCFFLSYCTDSCRKYVLFCEAVWNKRQIDGDVWNLGRRDKENARGNQRERQVVKKAATEVYSFIQGPVIRAIAIYLANSFISCTQFVQSTVPRALNH